LKFGERGERGLELRCGLFAQCLRNAAVEFSEHRFGNGFEALLGL
jgi:hypothetical protein